MNDTTVAAREAARNRSDGRFGEQHLADPGTSVLGEATRVVFDELLAPDDYDRYHFPPGRQGEWHYVTHSVAEKVRVAAAAAVYRDLEQPEAILAKLEAMARGYSRATLLIDQLNGLKVKECRVRATYTDGRVPTVYVQDKGTRGAGSYEVLDSVIDASPGYGLQIDKVGGTFGRRRAQFVPQTVQADPAFDLSDGDGVNVQAVYMMGGWGQGYPPGSLLLATGRSGGVVEGVAWMAGVGFEPTCCAADNLKANSGRLRDYNPGTVTIDDIDTMPTSRIEMYRAVMGVPFHQDGE